TRPQTPRSCSHLTATTSTLAPTTGMRSAPCMAGVRSVNCKAEPRIRRPSVHAATCLQWHGAESAKTTTSGFPRAPTLRTGLLTERFRGQPVLLGHLWLGMAACSGWFGGAPAVTRSLLGKHE